MHDLLDADENYRGGGYGTKSGSIAAVKGPRATVKSFEASIANLADERSGVFDSEGNFLFQRDGSDDTVKYTPDELAQMKGATLTHNHSPTSRSTKGSGFSGGDIAFAQRYQLGEMRAVSGGFLYSLKPGPKGWGKIDEGRWNAIADKEIAKVRDWKARQQAKGRNTEDRLLTQMNFNVWHNITRQYASEKGLQYSRIRIGS